MTQNPRISSTQGGGVGPEVGPEAVGVPVGVCVGEDEGCDGVCVGVSVGARLGVVAAAAGAEDESATTGAPAVLVDAPGVVLVAAADVVAGPVLDAAGVCCAGVTASSAAEDVGVGALALVAVVAADVADAAEVGSPTVAVCCVAAVERTVAWGWVAAVGWLGGVEPRATVATVTAMPTAATEP